jgi:hypothetical protein
LHYVGCKLAALYSEYGCSLSNRKSAAAAHLLMQL